MTEIEKQKEKMRILVEKHNALMMQANELAKEIIQCDGVIKFLEEKEKEK